MKTIFTLLFLVTVFKSCPKKSAAKTEKVPAQSAAVKN